MPAFCRKTSLCSSAFCQSTMSLSNWAAVAFLARVLELVERQVFGVQQGPVLQKEVVVDRLVHVVLPTCRPALCEPVRTDTSDHRVRLSAARPLGHPVPGHHGRRSRW